MELLNQAMELQNLPMAEEVVEGVVVMVAAVVVEEEVVDTGVVVVEVLEVVVEEEEEVEVVERRPAPQCLNQSQVLWRRRVSRPNVQLSQTGLISSSFDIDMFCMNS